MHYNWAQHQHLAKTIALVPNNEIGTGLALMGIAFLILSRDLEDQLTEAKTQPAKRLFRYPQV